MNMIHLITRNAYHTNYCPKTDTTDITTLKVHKHRLLFQTTDFDSQCRRKYLSSHLQ